MSFLRTQAKIGNFFHITHGPPLTYFHERKPHTPTSFMNEPRLQRGNIANDQFKSPNLTDTQPQKTVTRQYPMATTWVTKPLTTTSTHPQHPSYQPPTPGPLGL
jgi:hypothetical protein